MFEYQKININKLIFMKCKVIDNNSLQKNIN